MRSRSDSCSSGEMGGLEPRTRLSRRNGVRCGAGDGIRTRDPLLGKRALLRAPENAPFRFKIARFGSLCTVEAVGRLRHVLPVWTQVIWFGFRCQRGPARAVTRGVQQCFPRAQNEALLLLDPEAASRKNCIPVSFSACLRYAREHHSRLTPSSPAISVTRFPST